MCYVIFPQKVNAFEFGGYILLTIPNIKFHGNQLIVCPVVRWGHTQEHKQTYMAKSILPLRRYFLKMKKEAKSALRERGCVKSEGNSCFAEMLIVFITVLIWLTQDISNASRQIRLVRSGINGTRPKFQKDFSVNSQATAMTAFLPFFHSFTSSLPVKRLPYKKINEY